MKIIAYKISDTQIAEISADEILIHSAGDGLDLLGNLYFQGFAFFS